jgi:hypothetical protein
MPKMSRPPHPDLRRAYDACNAAMWSYGAIALCLLGILLMLPGCQEVQVADIKGACDVFDRPEQPVLGKRKVDQRWIDRAVEAGVSACGWPRPKAEQVVGRAVAQMR